jgi:hypothetical protein
MGAGLAMIAVGLVLIYITPDAVKQNQEINRYLARVNYRSFPRLRRFNMRLAERGQRVGRIYGTAIGLLGVIAGLILIVRAI